MATDRPPRRLRPPRSPLVVIATTMMLALGVASAGAASNIEGIWSFNGGQIGVQRLSNGTYSGTVVVETKFAECTHEVGEPIWTGMTAQPDGSYWGLHQWFSGNCAKNPDLGPTAWRILEEANGSYYLRVCFSSPGTSQPTIAANGSDSAATYGCTNSALTAPLPGSGKAGSGVAGPKESLTLPSAKKCLSARLFKIHLADPKYDPLKTVTVTLKGRKIATSRRGKFIVATINLKRFPKGTFTIKIRATTVLGHSLSATRTFHTCVKKTKAKKRGTKG